MRKKLVFKDHLTVEYNDSTATRDEVFTKIINFIVEHHLFSSEVVYQNDATQLESPKLLADIVNDLLEIEYEYLEDKEDEE